MSIQKACAKQGNADDDEHSEGAVTQSKFPKEEHTTLYDRDKPSETQGGSKNLDDGAIYSAALYFGDLSSSETD